MHYNPTTGILEVYGSVGLEPGSCVQCSKETFTFQFVEISMGGSVHNINKSAQQIVGLYSIS